MTEEQRVELIRPGVQRAGGTWADLGAGSGAFTRTLASLLVPGARIYAVDRDERALRSLPREASGVSIQCVTADLTRELSLPPLDGVLLANSLHFQADASQALRAAARWLKPGAPLIVVEYDTSRANPWVPHPVPWSELPVVVESAGLVDVRRLGVVPSSYHGSMYAAVCRRPASG